MKRLNLTRKQFLLFLIILCGVISIVFYWIPYLSEISKFADNIKYEIIGGYVSNQYLEKNIYSHIFLSIMSIICILFLFVMCILSYKKETMIKYIGIGIIVQTFFMVFLKFWNNNLVDANYHVDIATEVISLKHWLMISITICIIISILYIFNKKLTYVILCIATLLQIFYMIELFKLNLGFLTQESIENPNYLSVIFQCINGMVIYILYWILLIDSAKSISEE